MKDWIKPRHPSELGCIRLVAALHGACVALEMWRQGSVIADAQTKQAIENIGRHVAMAVAAIPEPVLRAGLLGDRTVGGEEVYRLMKVSAEGRAAGKAAAA